MYISRTVPPAKLYSLIYLESFWMSAVYTHRYTICQGDKIGSGATCDVYKGISKETGMVCALKVFKKSWSKQRILQEREIEALKMIKHKNIVQLYDLDREKVSGQYVLVMEFSEYGTLHTYLNEVEQAFGLKDGEMLTLLKNLESGLAKLVEVGYVHRDIKPSNILKFIDANGSSIYKLSDFGAAKKIKEKEEFMSLVGTEEYLHPNIYEKVFINHCLEKGFNSSVDMWSLGITLYQCSAGDIPFKPLAGPRKNREIMFQMISKKESGVIAAKQSKEGKLIWERHLPSNCNISQYLRVPIQAMIAGLLDTSSKSAWTFQTFSREVKDILEKKVLHVFYSTSALTLKLYLSPELSIAAVQEEIAFWTAVKNSDQLLFYNFRLFPDLVRLKRVAEFPMTSWRKPIILVDKNLNKLEKMLLPEKQPLSNPEFNKRPCSDEDYYLAKSTCGLLYKMMTSVKQLIQESMNLQDAYHSLLGLVENKLTTTDISLHAITQMLNMPVNTEGFSGEKALAENTCHQKINEYQKKLMAISIELNEMEGDFSFCKDYDSVRKIKHYYTKGKHILSSFDKTKHDKSTTKYEVQIHLLERRSLHQLYSMSVNEMGRQEKLKQKFQKEFLIKKWNSIILMNDLQNLQSSLESIFSRNNCTKDRKKEDSLFEDGCFNLIKKATEVEYEVLLKDNSGIRKRLQEAMEQVESIVADEIDCITSDRRSCYKTS